MKGTLSTSTNPYTREMDDIETPETEPSTAGKVITNNLPINGPTWHSRQRRARSRTTLLELPEDASDTSGWSVACKAGHAILGLSVAAATLTLLLTLTSSRTRYEAIVTSAFPSEPSVILYEAALSGNKLPRPSDASPPNPVALSSALHSQEQQIMLIRAIYLTQLHCQTLEKQISTDKQAKAQRLPGACVTLLHGTRQAVAPASPLPSSTAAAPATATPVNEQGSTRQLQQYEIFPVGFNYFLDIPLNVLDGVGTAGVVRPISPTIDRTLTIQHLCTITPDARTRLATCASIPQLNPN